MEQKEEEYNNKNKFKTPMMQQYAEIKKEYPDCLLLFRMGDFYELFLDDAEIGAKVLDITLTARNKGSDGKIPMCGVPYHSVDSYLAKIIKAGHKAAICEQVSKPSAGKDLVQRKVVRIVTPGTVLDDTLLEENAYNYVMTFLIFQTQIVFAYADISTGKFFISTSTIGAADSVNEVIGGEIKRLNPSEIVLTDDMYNNYDLLSYIQTTANTNIYPFKFKKLSEDEEANYLKNFFNVKSLSIFDLDGKKEQIKVATLLIDYLQYTQKNNVHHIKTIINASKSKYMRLDAEALNNLEIFYANRSDSSKKSNLSLANTIDKTQTAMGARLIREWLMYPLLSKENIEERQNSITDIVGNHEIRSELGENLKNISDIERGLSKIGTGTGNARDLQGLSNSINISSKILSNLSFKEKAFRDNISLLESSKSLCELIDSTITDEPPNTVREGGMIKDGINKNLDDIKASIKDSKSWIANLESKEKEKTKIPTLKVGFNSVFGYYIEVSKANSTLVPDNYVRKQTLVNAERYITQELKEKEELVLNAEEKINEIEFEVFQNTCKKVLEYSEDIQKTSDLIAKVDCYYSLATIAIERNYIKPKIFESTHFNTKLIEARHPVVESVLQTGEFTPNSTDLNKNSFLHLITGPNMSGKSTYIRQVALIQVLAQIGSYVPAYEADISIVDGVYTRIGAGDALAQGLSTFMVEMIETAKILRNATSSSLIILDEVGRGTSTIDGLSIARAVVEYIHNMIGAKTLFATHFHELIELGQRLKKLENYRIKVIEDQGSVKFLHKVEQGGTDKSYGVEVAKLAGVPDEVVKRAQELLEKSQKEQLKFDI